MAAERESGLQALQQGNFAQAITLLEAACAGSPNDYDALLYLGAAYGQAGRQMDAIHTITRAVQLQPASAQARYNLGIAMEQGGYREQAIQAIQQALTLQPDYPRAQDSLRRLLPESAPAVSVPAPPPLQSASSSYTETQVDAPAYGQTPATSSELAGSPAPGADNSAAGAAPPAAFSPQSAYSAPAEPTGGSLPQFGIGQVDGPLQTPPSPSGTAPYRPVENFQSGLGAQPVPPSSGQPGAISPGTPYSAPAPQPMYGSPYQPQQAPPAYGSPYQPQAGAAGQSQNAPAYGAPPPASGYNQAPLPYGQQPGPSPYAPPAGAGSYGAPPALPSGGSLYNPPGAPPAYGAALRPARETVPDTFDIAQAFKDMGRVLTAPRAFFQDQAGRYGLKAPMALLLIYTIVLAIGSALQRAHPAATAGPTPPALQWMESAGPLIGIAILVPAMAISFLLYSGLVHLCGLLFSNSAPYSASFRAVVYAYAPFVILSLIGAVLTFTLGTAGALIVGLLMFAALVWYVVLLVMGISECQQISGGAAFGVVVISAIVSMVVLFVIGFVMAMIFAASVAPSLHGGAGLILRGS